jgi:hypothetical protein
MADVSDFDERMRDGHFEAKWSGRPKVVIAPPAPPPPPETSIGSLTIQGYVNVTEGKLSSYSVSNNGDAEGLSYLWTVVGGTGSSTTKLCDVTWGDAGAGKVTCKITSSDPGVTDSPKSKVSNVTIAEEEPEENEDDL